MKINETKLSILSVPRSITCISWFQELWGSIPDLHWSAEVSLLVLSPVRSQQRFSNAYVSEWMKNQGSIMLDSAENSNCHEWCNTSTVPKAAQQFMDLASKVFNYAGESRIEQEQCKVLEEFCRKMWESKNGENCNWI